MSRNKEKRIIMFIKKYKSIYYKMKIIINTNVIYIYIYNFPILLLTYNTIWYVDYVFIEQSHQTNSFKGLVEIINTPKHIQ